MTSDYLLRVACTSPHTPAPADSVQRPTYGAKGVLGPLEGRDRQRAPTAEELNLTPEV